VLQHGLSSPGSSLQAPVPGLVPQISLHWSPGFGQLLAVAAEVQAGMQPPLIPVLCPQNPPLAAANALLALNLKLAARTGAAYATLTPVATTARRVDRDCCCSVTSSSFVMAFFSFLSFRSDCCGRDGIRRPRRTTLVNPTSPLRLLPQPNGHASVARTQKWALA